MLIINIHLCHANVKQQRKFDVRVWIAIRRKSLYSFFIEEGYLFYGAGTFMGMNKICISILVDNRAQSNLKTEHGFSAWIEVQNYRILFDTGQGTTLLSHAAKLGCDLCLTDTLVLSHGHYDHTGAIAQVLKQNPAIKVYCHPKGVVSRYSIRDRRAPKNISMPETDKSAILNMPPDQMHWVVHPFWLHPALGLSGPIPRMHPLENVGGPFFLDPEGTRPDPIEDEMAMWIKSDNGLIILTGCCHAGLVNTVNYIRHVSAEQKIAALIGGFHLAHASPQRLEATCQALDEWNVTIIVPCHCTGMEAVTMMQYRLSEKIVHGYAGLRLEL